MPVTVITAIIYSIPLIILELDVLDLEILKHRLKTGKNEAAVTELYDLGPPVFSTPIFLAHGVSQRDSWSSPALFLPQMLMLSLPAPSWGSWSTGAWGTCSEIFSPIP